MGIRRDHKKSSYFPTGVVCLTKFRPETPAYTGCCLDCRAWLEFACGWEDDVGILAVVAREEAF
jgi:hypothetical protein